MKRDAARPPSEWNRHSIKAEVHSRGMSLSGIARDAGLPDSACRHALMGLSRKGADAIAAALQIPFDTLFPADMFVRSRSSHAKPNPKNPATSRQKRKAAPASERASA
ncbi:helix-turn-helix domain-containing protein [Aurantimonas sp. 22II-16-19i]|uniref:helix-turn-helix domain-containing protein n=1 Tax=Aurantimonas sp. 22II-16-19i TaxID=1317114 RepID=UPI0009F7BDC3|nr:helix-turn-helix domain-containing protein [Aurantimonas sp. 22II-16-19i]ORE93244.1 Nlp family transcriptional regulator [Aurantimonas sp. 22II-16-19i]